jgi:ribosomal-protein-alanine N-acetyltransferase
MRPEELAALEEIEQHSFKSPWERGTLAAELTRAWARVEVARLRGRPVGFIDYWLVADELQLLAIATHPDVRRRGVGGRLIARLLEVARERAVAVATLEVRRGNRPAIALYERAGFVVAGTRRGYYADGEDALVMLWRPGAAGSGAGGGVGGGAGGDAGALAGG